MKRDTPEIGASRPRTVLGFDYGTVRIGVAVGQELLKTARPLAVLQSRGQRPDWPAIERLIHEWRPGLLVVGVPRHADASAAPLTEPALRFGRRLHGRYGLPVETIDERLSSWAAGHLTATHARLLRDGRHDAEAAALILDSWFNQGRRPDPPAQ